MKNGKLREWNPESLHCSTCGLPFTTECDWQDRQDLHKPDCPRLRTAGKMMFMGEVFCDCNLVAHARCCPECNRSKLCPVCGQVPSEACEAHHDQLLEGSDA